MDKPFEIEGVRFEPVPDDEIKTLLVSSKLKRLIFPMEEPPPGWKYDFNVGTDEFDLSGG